jgi:hypothetical protein
MEKTKADKLIDKIENAKDWLEKAKDEYKNSNPERAGLILNLAQAEVKHAWELSHEQSVSKFVTAFDKKPARRSNLKYIIPIAASLVLLAGLGVGAHLSGFFSPALKSKNVSLAQGTNSGAILPNQEIATVSKMSSPSLTELKTTDKDDVVAQTDLMAGNPPVAQPAEDTKPHDKQVRYANSVPERAKTSVVDSKPSLKAVSRLSIDEDALTKEASHSLRIGK